MQSFAFVQHISPRLRALCTGLLLLCLAGTWSSCGVYTFKDVSVPPEVKTIRIGYIENKARYVNPLLSPRLTDQLNQKIASYTKLQRVTDDNAHYQISGTVTNYNSMQTVGVSAQNPSINRLTVTVHIVFVNLIANKTEEFDVSRNFDFSANLSLTQAEGTLLPEVIKNMTDEIFNHIFSNW
jgi:hypothetical protein